MAMCSSSNTNAGTTNPRWIVCTGPCGITCHTVVYDGPGSVDHDSKFCSISGFENREASAAGAVARGGAVGGMEGATPAAASSDLAEPWDLLPEATAAKRPGAGAGI